MLTNRTKYLIHNPYDFNLSKSFMNFINEIIILKSESNARNINESESLDFFSNFQILQKNEYDYINYKLILKTKIENQEKKEKQELQKKIDLLVNEEHKQRDHIISNQLNKRQEFHPIFKKSRSDAIKKEKTRINAFNDSLNKLIENEAKDKSKTINDCRKSFHFDFIEFYASTIINFLQNFKKTSKIYLLAEVTTSMDLFYLSLLSFINTLSKFENIWQVNFNDITAFNEANWAIKTCQEKTLQLSDNNFEPLKKIDFTPILNFIKEHLTLKFDHVQLPKNIRENFLSYLEVCHWIIHRHIISKKDPKYFLDKIKIPELIKELEKDINNIYISKSLKNSDERDKKIVHIISNLISSLATFHQRLKIIGKANGEKIWTQYLTEGLEYGCKYHKQPQVFIKALVIAACQGGTELGLTIYLKKAREYNIDLNSNLENFDSTARELAMKNGYPNIARLLIEYNVETEMNKECKSKNKL